MPGERIRVVHCIWSLAVGGAERQLAEVICGLPPDRFDQTVVVLRPGGEFLPRVEQAGCRVMCLVPRPRERSGWGRSKADLAIGMVRLVRYLRRRRIDVIHGKLGIADTIAVVCGRLAGVPAIMTSRVSLCRDPTGRTRKQRLMNRTNRAADLVVVNSRAVVRDVTEHEGVDRSRQRLVYNGVDLDRFSPVPADERRARRAAHGFGPDDRVIVCVSNLHPYKGHLDLIRAFARLGPQRRNLTLVLIGRDVGAAPRVRELATALGVAPWVRHIGQVTDVEQYLSISDLLVHPSHEEGFANAILEAMSAGLPVVACDVGGNPEAVGHGLTGLLVPARDPEALADAIDTLLANAGRAEAMGRAGRARVEQHFGLGRMVDDFAALYVGTTGWPAPRSTLRLPRLRRRRHLEPAGASTPTRAATGHPL